MVSGWNIEYVANTPPTSKKSAESEVTSGITAAASGACTVLTDIHAFRVGRENERKRERTSNRDREQEREREREGEREGGREGGRERERERDRERERER